MRFMMIVKASPDSEAGAPPSRELIQAMTRYNEELVNAGVLLAGDGLLPSSKGARVKFSKGKVEVVDGPFAETKELVAGFWMIQVKSKEEAVAWARRCPNPMGEGAEGELELRQVAEAADFPPEVLSPEDAAKEAEIFERAKRNAASR